MSQASEAPQRAAAASDPAPVRHATPPADSDLRAAVVEAFGALGPLARVDPNYREREVQSTMALAVADAIDARSVLVAEAGTGVGKTFAYLVPTLLSGGRALVSTATKSLQDQLFLRDIPRLCDALGLAVTVALLKGRSSYLCLHRMQLARQAPALTDPWAVRTLARIERWSQSTRAGDLAEVEGLDERSEAIALVTSTRENCLGAECPQYRQCHVLQARREAMAADVVVVNHHLFFADLTLRESGVAELLPSVEIAVFDEAHQLAEAGVQFLGAVLGSSQLTDLARDILAAGLQLARGLQPWQDIAGACEQAARTLRLEVAGRSRELRGSLKLRWDERSGDAGFARALVAAAEALQAARAALDTVSELAPDFDKLAARAQALSALAARFAGARPPDRVRWIDVSTHQVRLVESPLDIRDALRQQIEAGPKAWIFTSATLGDDERLSWFTEGAGLEEARTLRVGSPFDYGAHARLYVPRQFPKPNEPGHGPAVARLAARCASAAKGRTFVLTTTLRALRTIADALPAELEALGEQLTVLAQGQAPKRQLLQRFLDEPCSVLVGSQSFWEGIDVPGDALQCVLIDKLPFPPPNDPLVEARIKRLEAEGRDAFDGYFIAEAAVSLKQGAGRLIRSEEDRGLLVVCDPRLATMGYGRRLRAALPPMGVAASETEALQWLASLSDGASAPADAPF